MNPFTECSEFNTAAVKVHIKATSFLLSLNSSGRGPSGPDRGQRGLQRRVRAPGPQARHPGRHRARGRRLGCHGGGARAREQGARGENQERK